LLYGVLVMDLNSASFIILLVVFLASILSVPVLWFTLNRQAEKTKSYLLGELSKQIDDCDNRADRLEEKLSREFKKYGSALDTIEMMRAELSEAKIANRRLKTDIEDEKKKVKKLDEKLSNETQKRLELAERVLYLERQNEKLERHNNVLASRLGTDPLGE